MSPLRIDIPQPVVDELRRLAAKENVPMEQYVASLLTRYVKDMQGWEYIKERAKRAPSRERILEILRQAPDVPPVPGDEME